MNVILLLCVIGWFGHFLYKNHEAVIRGFKYAFTLPLFTKLHFLLSVLMIISFGISMFMTDPQGYVSGHTALKYISVVYFIIFSALQFKRYLEVGFKRVFKEKHGPWVILSYFLISIPPLLDTFIKDYPQLPFYTFSFFTCGIVLLFLHEAELVDEKYF